MAESSIIPDPQFQLAAQAALTGQPAGRQGSGRRGGPGRYPKPPGTHHRPTRRRPNLNFGKRHEAIISLLLANPNMTNIKLGEELGYTPTYIGMITRSDAFRELYARALAEHRKIISQEVVHRTAQVANQALGLLAEQLTSVGSAMPHAELRETADMALGRLGFGGRANGGPDGPMAPTQVTVNVGASDLQAARERAAKLVEVAPAPEGRNTPAGPAGEASQRGLAAKRED